VSRDRLITILAKLLEPVADRSTWQCGTTAAILYTYAAEVKKAVLEEDLRIGEVSTRPTKP
jgi:hypothetical protein